MRVKQKTKDLIFKSAVKLFSEKGYHATSIREIAKSVGIKESSIYNHYSGKNKILEAIMHYYAQGFQKAIPNQTEIRKLLTCSNDPVKIWLQGTKEFLRKLPALWQKTSCILLNEMFVDQKCRRFILENIFKIQKEAISRFFYELKNKKLIKECDVTQKALDYTYMIQGLEIENRLLLLEGQSQEKIEKKIFNQISNFIQNLKK